jgi:phosphoribosyl 1,2-cyclic phosphodiesterase
MARLGQKQSGDPEIYFTHLNHTNPVNSSGSIEHEQVTSLGWHVAFEGQQITL